MKLVRKVRWSEVAQEYEVEWIAYLGEEVLPTDFRVHVAAGHVVFKRELTKEGDIYRGSTTYAEERIADVEQDTLKLIEAIKEEIKRARENRVRAKALTVELEFDVE